MFTNRTRVRFYHPFSLIIPIKYVIWEYGITSHTFIRYVITRHQIQNYIGRSQISNDQICIIVSLENSELNILDVAMVIVINETGSHDILFYEGHNLWAP